MTFKEIQSCLNSFPQFSFITSILKKKTFKLKIYKKSVALMRSRMSYVNYRYYGLVHFTEDTDNMLFKND